MFKTQLMFVAFLLVVFGGWAYVMGGMMNYLVQQIMFATVRIGGGF